MHAFYVAGCYFPWDRGDGSGFPQIYAPISEGRISMFREMAGAAPYSLLFASIAAVSASSAMASLASLSAASLTASCFSFFLVK